MTVEQAADGDHAPLKPKLKASSLALWIGLTITAGYVGFWATYLARNFEAVQSLTPNEFGDFMGGTFGPLAFLWLVLGYFLQRSELRYSAEALWMQSEELRQSVEAQRDLVGVTRDQLHLEHSRNRPLLSLIRTSSSKDVNTNKVTNHMRLINLGSAVTELKMSSPFWKGDWTKAFLDNGAHWDFKFNTDIDALGVFEINVRYSSSSGARESCIFEMRRRVGQTSFHRKGNKS